MEEIQETREAGSAREMGLIRRMLGVFFSPGETFASVGRQAGHLDWLVPLIVVALVSIISLRLTMPIVQAETLGKMRQRIIEQKPDLSEEKMQETMEKVQGVTETAAFINAPVGAAAWLFVQAAVLLALVNFVLGGRGAYKKVLAVTGYSSLIAVPAAIVTVPLMLARGTMHVQVGLGLLLPASLEGSFLFHFLTYITLFSIWQYSLVSIGVGAVSGIGTKRAAWGVFVLFFAFILIVASIQGFVGGLTAGTGK